MNKNSVQYLHHCILALIALLYSWATIYSYPNAPFISCLIGCGTYIIYRIAFYKPIFNLDNFELKLKVKPSNFDLIFIVVVSIITLSTLPPNYILAYGVTGFLSAFYFTIIHHPKSKQEGIRAFPFIKNLFLATMWTVATAALPIYFYRNLDNLDFNVSIRFLFILIICVAIDLRDIKTDHKARTTTLPTWIGFKKTKLICFILLTIYFALIASQTKYDFSFININSDEWIYYATGLILGAILIYLNPKHQQNTFTKLLDGCLLLQAAGLFLISALKIN